MCPYVCLQIYWSGSIIMQDLGLRLKSHTLFFEQVITAQLQKECIQYSMNVCSMSSSFVLLSLSHTCVSCIVSLPFINPLPWPHGMEKVSILCTLQDHAGSNRSSGYFLLFTVNSDIVAIHFFFCLLYCRKICDFGCSLSLPIIIWNQPKILMLKWFDFI